MMVGSVLSFHHALVFNPVINYPSSAALYRFP